MTDNFIIHQNYIRYIHWMNVLFHSEPDRRNTLLVCNLYRTRFMRVSFWNHFNVYDWGAAHQPTPLDIYLFCNQFIQLIYITRESSNLLFSIYIRFICLNLIVRCWDKNWKMRWLSELEVFSYLNVISVWRYIRLK